MLVVIDIQECYLDEFQKQQKKYERMIAGISKRIQQAREIGEMVVNMTHFRDGFTLPEVVELINSHRNSYYLDKNDEDGSSTLDYFIQRRKIKVDKIELCGCFRDVCVLKTWRGLRHLNYIVTPVNRNLTIATTTSRLQPECYPPGYIAGENNEIQYGRG